MSTWRCCACGPRCGSVERRATVSGVQRLSQPCALGRAAMHAAPLRLRQSSKAPLACAEGRCVRQGLSGDWRSPGVLGRLEAEMRRARQACSSAMSCCAMRAPRCHRRHPRQIGALVSGVGARLPFSFRPSSAILVAVSAVSAARSTSLLLPHTLPPKPVFAPSCAWHCCLER